MNAQSITKEFDYDNKSKIQNVKSFSNGNFLFIEKTKKGNKFTVINEDLEVSQQFITKDKIDFDDLKYFSPSGMNIIEKEKKDYCLINESKSFLSDENLDEDISDRFFYKSGTRVDVVNPSFVTDQYYVSISRKEGKENYHDGNYSEIEIFLFRKDLKTGESNYFPLELPEDVNFTSLWPKLLYHNESFFILTKLIETDDSKRIYNNIKYDYEGKIISSYEHEINVLEPEQEFAILNYGYGSFIAKQSTKNGSSMQKNVMTYQLPTSLAKGYLKYDPYNESYYLYAAINSKKEDSGMLIYKYDNSGNLKWRQYFELPDTNLKYLNSFNRHLEFEISSKFVGFTVYSTKGKNYCDFYVVDKATGDLVNSKQFRNYNIENNGNNYNNIYAPFNIKFDGVENLVIDSKTTYTALYDKNFMKYLNELNSKSKAVIKTNYLDNGFVLVRSNKNEKRIDFDKFLFD